MSDERLVPKLRFSGFDDEWSLCKFDDLFNFQVAGDMKKELFNEEYSEEFKYPLFANALEEDGLLGYYKEYKYEPDSITVTARGNVGHATVRNEKFNAVGRLIILTSKNDLNMNFFSEYINNNVKVHIESTGVPQLTAPSLKINKLHYPSLNEQNKISNFLLELNKKMELLEKKHDSYVNFKKYLMQQIFAQKLRFDFDDDWEIKKLDELSKIQRGASPRPISSKKWYDFENKNVGWVRIGDVTSSSKYLTETKDYFSDEGVKKSRFLPKGSLIMSICATIGKPIITDIDTCIHDGFVGFSELEVNKEFLYYYLNMLEPKFYSLSQTGSQANLNSDLVGITKIGVPSLEEQEKIVNFLSLVDKKIELMEKYLEECNRFKKGLLQQMFV